MNVNLRLFDRWTLEVLFEGIWSQRCTTSATCFNWITASTKDRLGKAQARHDRRHHR